MSKGPDLSAFPIPRKGGARPIVTDVGTEASPDGLLSTTEDSNVSQSAIPTPSPVDERQTPASAPEALTRQQAVGPPSGQMIATTVKLDENRYLRLSDAGRPGPGRLKRRTTQDIMIEALDEWFYRRGL